jgi:hypothetical protein
MSAPESYIIQHEDGNRYGPVELSVLRAWEAAGRVGAETRIEIVTTAEVVPYADLVPPAPPASECEPPPMLPLPETPPNYVNYPRGYQPPVFAVSVADKERKNAWMYFWLALGGSTIGLITCGIFALFSPVMAILGIVAANKAIAAGSQDANGAKSANIVILILSGLFVLGVIGFFVVMGFD